jgi:hypothetical protein
MVTSVEDGARNVVGWLQAQWDFGRGLRQAIAARGLGPTEAPRITAIQRSRLFRFRMAWRHSPATCAELNARKSSPRRSPGSCWHTQLGIPVIPHAVQSTLVVTMVQSG